MNNIFPDKKAKSISGRRSLIKNKRMYVCGTIRKQLSLSGPMAISLGNR